MSDRGSGLRHQRGELRLHCAVRRGASRLGHDQRAGRCAGRCGGRLVNRRKRGRPDVVGAVVEGPRPVVEEQHHPEPGQGRQRQIRRPELQELGSQSRQRCLEGDNHDPGDLPWRNRLVLVRQQQSPEHGQHLERATRERRSDEPPGPSHGHRVVQHRRQHLLDRQQLQARQDGPHTLPNGRRLPQDGHDQWATKVHRVPDHRRLITNRRGRAT